MNRTKTALSLALLLGIVSLRGQEPVPPPAAGPQGDPIEAIAATMQAAEQRAKSFRLELRTVGRLPDGDEVTTRGVLRVLRGAQPKLHAVVEFAFADGVEGRMESAQTERGIHLFEDNPSFGELYLHIGPEVVSDLEWAGEVLDRADLPGMADRRAVAPLGSSMVRDLQRHFELTIDARAEREAEPGQWLLGKRRAGLEGQDKELLLADRVELFVRQRDHALVEVRHLQAEKVIQHIVVTRLEVDVELPPAEFVVDGRGQRLRELAQYQPMAEEIERVLRQAEAKSEAGLQRPSKR